MKGELRSLGIFLLSTAILGIFTVIYGGYVSSFLFYVSGLITLLEMIIYFQCVSGISVERELSSSTLMAGENLEVTIHVSQRWRLPLSWQTISDRLAQGSTSRESRVIYAKDFYLNKRKIEYKIYGLKRGRYKFVPLTIYGGDFLGIVERQKKIDQEQILTVYPKVVPLPTWSPSLNIRGLNAVTRERRLGQEPNTVSGLRNYRYGDRLQHIDWKASARGQGLKVKEFELEISQKALIILDQSENSYLELDDEIFERAVSLTASLTSQLLRQSFATSVLLTGKKPMLLRRMENKVQLPSFLDVLIDLQPDGRRGPAMFTSIQGVDRLEPQKVLFITPRADAETYSFIQELKQRNFSVAWFWLASPKDPLPQSVKEKLNQLQVDFWNINQDRFDVILQKGDSIA